VIRDHQATPPFLHISRQTIQFNPASDAWVDVTAFANITAHRPPGGPTIQGTIDRLEEAVGLYRGEFLEGISLPDSPPFEEWTLLQREQSQRLVIEALHRLAQACEQIGQYERGLPHAWRQVDLDPWREKAHRQLMRLLTLSGQRGAALAQYETCRSLLAQELGVEPGEETTRLYEQIRDGRLKVPAPAPAPSPDLTDQPPRFLEEEQPQFEIPLFVAREGELRQLKGFLDLALAGQGRVVFVTGEAGSGKTALVQEFARRALETHPDVIVVSGNCNAYTGIGDPYLPFREALGLLTGNVEARWAAGAITGEHARRLWNTLPLTAQALVEHGPDLIDSFVLRGALLERASLVDRGARRASDRTDWLARLHELLVHTPTAPGNPSPQQSAVFAQYTSVLQALALQVPLLLVLDDLQWADAGSIGLLFHLGRRLTGSPILMWGPIGARRWPSGGTESGTPSSPWSTSFSASLATSKSTLHRPRAGTSSRLSWTASPTAWGFPSAPCSTGKPAAIPCSRLSSCEDCRRGGIYCRTQRAVGSRVLLSTGTRCQLG
jgi:hypothetical protein